MEDASLFLMLLHQDLSCQSILHTIYLMFPHGVLVIGGGIGIIAMFERHNR